MRPKNPENRDAFSLSRGGGLKKAVASSDFCLPLSSLNLNESTQPMIPYSLTTDYLIL